MSGDNSAVELAAIKEQLIHLTKSVDTITDSLSSIESINVSVAEINIRFENTQKELQTIWKKHDAVKTWTETHEKESDTVRRDLDTRIAAARIDCDTKHNAVRNELDNVVTTGKTSIWILSAVCGVAWAVVSGCSVWMFNHVNDNDKQASVMQYRIEQLEHKK